MRDDVRKLREEIITKLVSMELGDVHTGREILCVEQAASSGNIRLLSIFRDRLGSTYSLRVIKNAFDEIAAYGDGRLPEELINGHGMRMREIIQSELSDLFFKNMITVISVYAMSLPENEVNTVVEFTRRGIFDVDKIKEMLEEARSLPTTMTEGTL